MREDSGLRRGSPAGNLRPAQPKIETFTIASCLDKLLPFSQVLESGGESREVGHDEWGMQDEIPNSLSLSPQVGVGRGQDGEPFASFRANFKLFLNIWGLCGIRAVLYTLTW